MIRTLAPELPTNTQTITAQKSFLFHSDIFAQKRFRDLFVFRLLFFCVQWFWWPILVLLIPYIILVTIGVVVIQYAFSWCATDDGRDQTTVSYR